eukprot:GAHX01000974.1.p1 GENE.GAHX01000974.1~~GAHX01000974.1.p1  ORF type:complete len:299 (+),score=48.30 GAHX01000974.1:88-984(+)
MLKKEIHTLEEALIWPSKEIYRDVVIFVDNISNGIKSKALDSEPINNKFLNELNLFITEVRGDAESFDKTETLQDNKRFGNPHFRDWLTKIKIKIHAYNEKTVPGVENKEDVVCELTDYFLDSFGERMRLDYGTGHELSFILYLLANEKLGLISSTNDSFDILKTFVTYLQLVRYIQMDFRLEPAGSKGVWGIDDYQFLPLLFGASQLVGNYECPPAQFPYIDPTFFSEYYLFFGLIEFIKRMKTGFLYENSPILFALHKRDSWEAILKYLEEHFENEVLKPFPVAQHIKFGNILKYM